MSNIYVNWNVYWIIIMNKTKWNKLNAVKLINDFGQIKICKLIVSKIFIEHMFSSYIGKSTIEHTEGKT